MIRKYTTKDKKAVLSLFRNNTPNYFDISEEIDLENYLDTEIEDYFVVEENLQIIGAGGINYFPLEKTARISWDIIDPISQGKGIGKQLTQFRINHIIKKPEIGLIVVRTSQHVYQFYEKMGFKLEKVVKDYWAKDFDLYYMELNIKKF